nr:immunoglobulin heavy chain junction region [Macaca mulatta]MOY21505.1 immunoglobulin heavy chain junction region [Macaca mulatta]MOY21683.1 immunoglobulin heavy chain junction region [Macaca mulatta]MOY21737.1 immunoglobulin heavy chain junction region [Macaca mulatta]MOY21879.1 immunoglobulin heavy chain junction region [Macaca mulatta]
CVREKYYSGSIYPNSLDVW